MVVRTCLLVCGWAGSVLLGFCRVGTGVPSLGHTILREKRAKRMNCACPGGEKEGLGRAGLTSFRSDLGGEVTAVEDGSESDESHPAGGKAQCVPWGGGGARHAAPELTLSYELKPTPRRPLESRYGFVTEQPRMVQRAWWTYRTPYYGAQPYPTSGARVGTS